MTVIGHFTNFAQWVNKASSRIGGRGAVCTDAKGRILTMGAHFMRARDEDAFPVRYEYEAEDGTIFDMRRMVRKPARAFACAQTSGSSKYACPGNDGGEHSDVCDLLTSAIEEERGAEPAERQPEPPRGLGPDDFGINTRVPVLR